MQSKTLILGGGFGGMATAHTLRRLLPEDHRVIVVDQSPDFSVGATYSWVVTGERTPQDLIRSRVNLLPPGVELIQVQVTDIDPITGEVTTTQGKLAADYLVIALGAVYNLDVIPGLAAAHTFYTLDGAARLRDALADFQGGELLLLVPRAPFKCPPAPYETAMILHHWLSRQGLREQTHLSVYTIEPTPMMAAGPQVGDMVREQLGERGIAFHPLKVTSGVDAARQVVLFEDGEEAHFDLLISIPPHEAPRAVREAGLIGQSGWIPVDPDTLRVTGLSSRIPIFAIGDVTAVPLPGWYRPEAPLMLPKAGVFAGAHGLVVAAQIAADVLGTQADAVFDGKGFCYIEIGGGLAMKGDGSFFETPHPSMQIQLPDETQFQDKLAWVDQWLSGVL